MYCEPNHAWPHLRSQSYITMMKDTTGDVVGYALKEMPWRDLEVMHR